MTENTNNDGRMAALGRVVYGVMQATKINRGKGAASAVIWWDAKMEDQSDAFPKRYTITVNSDEGGQKPE